MKKLLFSFAILLISTSIFSQFKVGGGVTFGNRISNNQDIGAGLNIRCNYSFNPKLTLSTGYTYVIPSTIGGTRYTSWQINSDLHYNFLSKDNFKLYGLAGINYTQEKNSTSFTNGSILSTMNSSTGKAGLNVGIGANFKKYFGEVKYDSSYNQVALTLGIFF